MGAAGELIAEAADVFAVAVEDENRRMAAAVFAAFVDDVDETIAVDRAVVSRLPLELFGELGPVVLHHVAMVAFAEDDLRVGLRLRTNGGRGNCRGGESDRGSRGGGLHELAAIDGGTIGVWHGGHL